MEPLAWLAVASVVLVLVHLAIVGYLYHKGRDADGMGLFDVDAGAGAGAGTDRRTSGSVANDEVICPTCGTANEDGYRYCRSCVSDLSAGTRGTPGGANTGRLQS